MKSDKNHIAYQSPIQTIFPAPVDTRQKAQDMGNQFVSGFSTFDQGLQERSSEPLKDLSNIMHTKQSCA